MRKKVSIVGVVGVPACYGGLETLADYLVQHLSEGHELTVFCTKRSYSERPANYKNAELVYLSLKANGAQSVPYDIFSLLIGFFRGCQSQLVLGVGGAILFPFFKLFRSHKIIVNIDGLEWKREKWGSLAKFWFKFSEKLAVKFSDVVISDNRAIQDYVSDEYGVESVLIEYGGDHAKDIEIESDIAELYPFLYEDYSVNVCRVEPENNIHIVLEAFARMPSEKLVILGNWNNSNYGRKLKEKYQHHDNLILLPPIFDQHILGMIRSNCRIYVHPHSVGGTNPTLVEAMNTGLPIVGYDVIYNRETTENKALYFDSVESLVKIISEFNSEHGKNVGLNMLEIAKARYSWDIISKKYSDLF